MGRAVHSRWIERYTAEQIALVLTQAALGLDYYMEEEFNLYDVGPGSRRPETPAWAGEGKQTGPLHEWRQERIYELGLGCWEQETFADQLFLDDFRPLIQRVARAPGPGGGKVAFLALTMALILKAFTEYVSGAGRDLADELRGEVNKYLRDAWGVDLDRGIVNPNLAALHLPHAREAARRWRQRLELLTRAPLRAPFSDSQLASLNAYRAAFVRDPWFICLVNGCRGILRLDRDGLLCPKCDCRRNWTFSWMADLSWQRRFDEGRETGAEKRNRADDSCRTTG